MSTARFVDRFKMAVGQSPYLYILMRRSARAWKLLRDTDASIEEAAHESGFSSVRHMTHHFERIFGVPPEQARADRS